MGIPLFYSWITQTYPSISETIADGKLTCFRSHVDNLYIDVNGIVHLECMRNHSDDILQGVCNQIEVIIRVVKPKKMIFLAIDGVPRMAKMNKQRNRRFERSKDIDKEIQSGCYKKRFDNNAVTPGTLFMEKFDEYLYNHFQQRLASKEPFWRSKQVIIAGHLVPGEGEHKIVKFIREMKIEPDYDIETRHCIYGEDSDLVILGLCLHEPYMTLLKENRRAAKFSNSRNPCFELFHFSRIREQIDHNFQSLRDNRNFAFDFECLIDDWVLMSFLVGNDFMPSLPFLTPFSLPRIHDIYMEVLPELGGNINEKGVLNLKRFGHFMKALSVIERENLVLKSTAKNSDGSQGDFKSCNEDLSKTCLQTSGDATIADLSRRYVRTIQWMLKCYYGEQCSWSWFYSHVRTPSISDMAPFVTSTNLEFDEAEPLLPFEQLLAVLPPENKNFLPIAFQWLMDDPKSPIIDFYFKVDAKGNLHDLQPPLPCVDIGRLKNAVRSSYQELTARDLLRNKVGSIKLLQNEMSVCNRISSRPASPHIGGRNW